MRIAHDGQQRIQEQRDQRWHGADGAEQRDEEGEQCERRDRLDDADRAEYGLGHGFYPAGKNSQRDADDDARRKRDEHEYQVLVREAPEIGTEQYGEEFSFRLGFRFEIGTQKSRCLCKTPALQLGGSVQADHGLLIDAPLQLLQLRPCLGKPLRHVEAVEQHRIVAREVLAIVFEHAQLVALDFRVRGVDVHDVDPARRDRFIREAVVQARRRRERDGVGGFQPRPAIGAADEFLRQAELQARLPREIGQRADAEPLRRLFAHSQRIAVIETERHRGAQAERRERALQLRDARIAVELQDFLRDGAGVFRIEIDRTRFERRVQDARVAEPGAVHRAARRIAHRLHDDFTEDVRLREALGTDAQRLGICCTCY